MKLTLRSLGLMGAFLFGTFFYFSFNVPGFVEEFAKNYIKNKISEKVNKKINNFKQTKASSLLAKYASVLSRKHKQQIESLKTQLKSKAYIKLAAVIAEMRKLDCECRKKYAQRYKADFKLRLTSLRDANEKLVDFMKYKYMEISIELKRDIRIFTASNTIVFILLFLISLFKPGAIKHLFLPGVLLFTATLVCTAFYVFGQNWLLTIIYNDFMGYAYLGYLSFVFLFMYDIVFNRGRVTTNIISGIFNAIGSVDFDISLC